MAIHTKKRFKRIYIEITNVCNLSCKFCPETNRVKEFMGLDNFKMIISKIKDYTDIVYLHVKGEPLLHPNIKEILDICNDNNIKVNLTTNGTLLKEKIDILNNLRQINISLHSMIQNNCFTKEYFYNVFESIKDLNNVIVSLRLWSKEKGYDEIIDIISKYYNYQNLDEEFKINKAIELDNNIYLNKDEEFIWPSLNGRIINETGKCLALKEQIAILVDGTVVPCCLDNNGDIYLGNIYNEDLEHILNKDLSNLIIKNFEKGIITCDLCKTCGFLKRLENKRK